MLLEYRAVLHTQKCRKHYSHRGGLKCCWSIEKLHAPRSAESIVHTEEEGLKCCWSIEKLHAPRSAESIIHTEEG